MHTAVVSLELTVTLRVISVTVIFLFHLFELKNWLVQRIRPPLRFGEDKNPCMFMVLGLMVKSFDWA